MKCLCSTKITEWKPGAFPPGLDFATYLRWEFKRGGEEREIMTSGPEFTHLSRKGAVVTYLKVSSTLTL